MYRYSTLRGAFTSVEVLIVVLVIGILAAIVVPRYADAQQDSLAVTLQANLAIIQDKIDVQYHATGAYPDDIDPAWFSGNQLPRHPSNVGGVPAVQAVVSANQLHPTWKVLKDGVPGAYWYNKSEGVIRPTKI